MNGWAWVDGREWIGVGRWARVGVGGWAWVEGTRFVYSVWAVSHGWVGGEIVVRVGSRDVYLRQLSLFRCLNVIRSRTRSTSRRSCSRCAVGLSKAPSCASISARAAFSFLCALR